MKRLGVPLAPGQSISIAGTLLTILVLTSTVSGQVPSPTGSLFGRVLDEQNQILAGVRVTLVGQSAPQSASTDPKGDFHILNLPPGAYAATFELVGFETQHREVTVLLGRNAILSVTMLIAGASAAVIVEGAATAADSRQTETGVNFSNTELETIPTSRDLWAFVRQTPGVLVADMNVGGDAWSYQSGFAGKGSDTGQNTFNLDGVGITDIWGTTPVSMNFDTLDEIEIATGGSDPSISTPGVTINLVTKRGTNQLLGSAHALYNSVAGWDYGAEVGGPLWKDRVWLWGAGASNSFLGQTVVTGIGQMSQSHETIGHWNAKVSAQVEPANAVTFSFVDSKLSALGDGAAWDRTQPSTWNTDFETTAYRLEDSHVFSPRLFASAELSYLAISGTSVPQGGDQQTDRLDEVWLNTFDAFRVSRPQEQAGVTMSGFFDTGDLRHELRFGFGYRSIDLDSSQTWPGDMLIGSEFSDPNSLIPNNGGVTRPARWRALVHYYNTYLGDTIQAGPLTVNLGARFDYQQARNLSSSVPPNPVYPELLPAVQYGGDSGYSITWRKFQPRVGVSYSLGNNGATLLRASYSRFGSRLNNEILSLNAFPGAAVLWYDWNDLNGNHKVDPGELDFSKFLGPENVDAGNPGSSAPVNQVAASFKPATTDEFIAGVERQVLPGLSVSLAYTYRSIHNLAFTPVIGTTRANYQYLGNASGTVTANGDGNALTLNFSVPYYGLTTCPAPCSGTVLSNRPDFTQTYSGVEFQLVKALSHGWMLRASFAYNDWQQHVGPGAIFDPNNTVGAANVSGPALAATGNQSGPIWINATWQFNVSGLVQLPLGIEASANLFGRQGYPILYSVVVFLSNTYNFVTENQIGPVGATRTPSVFLLDLHVQKLFQIGKVTLGPVLDCLNAPNVHTVLQRQSLTGFYTAGPDSPYFQSNNAFNDPAELLSSRVFRGGIQINF